MLGTSTHQGAISTLCCRGYVWVHEEPGSGMHPSLGKERKELNVDDTFFGVPLGHVNRKQSQRASFHGYRQGQGALPWQAPRPAPQQG